MAKVEWNIKGLDFGISAKVSERDKDGNAVEVFNGEGHMKIDESNGSEELDKDEIQTIFDSADKQVEKFYDSFVTPLLDKGFQVGMGFVTVKQAEVDVRRAELDAELEKAARQ